MDIPEPGQGDTQAQCPLGLDQAKWALRLCIALTWFWDIHRYGWDGYSTLMQVLSEHASVDAALRARALYTASRQAFLHARQAPLERLGQEGPVLDQALADAMAIATC